MRRPSFQFYPSDWLMDMKLRRCSPAARGVWMDVLCILHSSDDGYGLLRWKLADIAHTVGASIDHVQELVDKGVLRGSDDEIKEPLVYVPRSGRRDGDPVTLIEPQPGPLWFSKRQVIDEHVRNVVGANGRFAKHGTSGGTNGAQKGRAGEIGSGSEDDDKGVTKGDGSSTSSSLSSSLSSSPSPPPCGGGMGGPKPPKCPYHKVVDAYHQALPNHTSVSALTKRREGLIRDRWNFVWKRRLEKGKACDTGAMLDWFKGYFEYAAKSRLLCGKVPGKDGWSPFMANLWWLLEEERFLLINEGEYSW